MQWRWRTFALALGWIVLAAICIRFALQLQEARSEAAGDVERLFAERISGRMVEGDGVVTRLLGDDLRGSRHQRFLVRLDSGHVLLISHNIDLAPRVDSLRPGDRVEFRGEYEWNDKGGVVHWTHHDPDGGRRGGWIRHGGRTYR